MKRPHIPENIKIIVRKQSKFRCGYCQILQRFSPIIFQFDHYIPVSKGGKTDESNLWLVCGNCNNSKSDKSECFDPETDSAHPIFNPHTDNWTEHFEWKENGAIIFGKTPVGRGTVALLKMNDERIVAVRREWISAGWHPPKDQSER
ncbi:MAG: HNH endonuclease [Pyrinomonadaceae bacterium]|nr:HNH endonuclease [Pyrinomonadaceae bacterium]